VTWHDFKTEGTRRDKETKAKLRFIVPSYTHGHGHAETAEDVKVTPMLSTPQVVA